MFKNEKLKAFLDENGVTYEAFGERIGVSKSMVNFIIHGYKQPSLAILARIAKEMGCTVDELLRKEE